jgi:isoleucyl-tRNA synthetase
LKQLGDVRGKIRNTARFLLGNLHDFDPRTDIVAYADLPELDRYMLHRISEVFEEVTEAFESYQFFKFFQVIQNFCVVDLSNFYLDIAKDRLYISAPDSLRRRSCQTVLQVALENLAKAIAPVLCHLAEDIWQFLPYATPYESVFESGWVNIKPEWYKPQLTPIWSQLRQVRTEVNKVLEQARTEKAIGSSLDAKVLLYVENEDFRQALARFQLADSSTGNHVDNHVDELRYFVLASQVEIVEAIATVEQATYSSTVEGLAVAVVKADGQKCDRCWNYSTQVGEFAEEPTICERCYEALQGHF